jgi:phage shock protein A
MSLLSRALGIITAKTNAILDKAENPDETLNLSYEKMVEALQDTKRHLADVVAERMSLAHQIEQVQSKLEQFSKDAETAVDKGRDDLATQVLQLKAQEAGKLPALQTAYDGILAQEQKLTQYCQTMQSKIEAFRTQKDILKAINKAATAQVAMVESITGIGDQMDNAGDALRRAQERADHMQAKAEALDNMMQSGTLEDPLDTRSSVEKQIDALHTDTNIAEELAAIKARKAQSKL